MSGEKKKNRGFRIGLVCLTAACCYANANISYAGNCERLAAEAGYEEASNLQDDLALGLEKNNREVRPQTAKAAYEHCLYEQYRQEFVDASSAEKMREFVATYATNDPDGLVPKVRDSLSKKEAENRVTAEKRQQEEDRKREQERPAVEIQYCVKNVPVAHAAIDRENKIAANGGPKNVMKLRIASEILVDCSEEDIRRSYAEYRKNGGTKSLSDLGWPPRR